MVLGIQILGVIFGCFMIYLTFLYKKRREFNDSEMAFWTLLAIGFMFIALFPKILDPIVQTLSLARTMDFFIIIGFMFLTGVGFYTYSQVRKTMKKVEDIVRKNAFDEKLRKEK